ncbi:MAG: GGDEF domain-containing protein [Clostridia bacterium]|nr:GGDEF domain-containing protein [Clostridia bacterium]
MSTPAPFAIAVFDINNLKEVNDTLGHVAGDEYIRKGSKLICDTFKHSPVFRIGGDEFAVIAQEVDYENVDKLMEEIKKRNEENALAGEVTVACGMKKHEREIDVASVFKKADDLMYQDKRNKKTC